MKEGCVCFSEMKLIQIQWMSHEDRQVLESKDVSKDLQKQVSLGTQWEGGILPCKATNLVFLVILFSFCPFQTVKGITVRLCVVKCISTVLSLVILAIFITAAADQQAL